MKINYRSMRKFITLRSSKSLNLNFKTTKRLLEPKLFNYGNE
jgi:hypothetical protein